MKRITQKEIVARLLFSRLGEWVPGYDLQKNNTPWGYLGVDADTRAHELSRDGYFTSAQNKYFIEHKKEGKYAYFRCTGRTKHEYVGGLKDWTFALNN